MSVLKINSENFSSVKASGKRALLDFYADWCGPCRMVAPIIEEIAGERDDVIIGKINVDESPELAREFGIVSIPTLIVIEGERVLDKATGARPKDAILSMLD